MRRRLTLLLIATLSVVLLAAGSKHKGDANRPFLGLWEGVDVNDGSKRTISITDHDRDGVLEVDSRDTYWTLCDGDRGLEQATGKVHHAVLKTKGEVICFGTMIKLPIIQTYELSKEAGTLFATPRDTGLIPITLHRVSD